MDHPPASDNYPKALSFSPFVSGTGRSAVSRHPIDIYGQPRILARWEGILYALAWPVVVGVVIGFGLIIALLVIRDPSTSQSQKKAGESRVASLEAAP
jgi:hypothetical protein